MIDSEDRRKIVDAMNTLMDRLAVTTANTGAKRLCIHFRLAQPTDKYVLRARYGGGCSASVRVPVQDPIFSARAL